MLRRFLPVARVARLPSKSLPCRFMTAEAAKKPTGPPIKKYMIYTTIIMFGIPGAIGGVFVYNLRTDDEFYAYFNDRYPDLIEAIESYVQLDESQLELSARDDIGPIDDTSALEEETVDIIAHLRSGKTVTFQTSGSATQKEIEAKALTLSSTSSDAVVSFSFDEGDESANKPAAAQALPGSFPPQMTWGSSNRSSSTASAPKKTPTSELRRELDDIRVQQAALEQSKYAGRDIDDVDEEIAQLERRKEEIKRALPRKRFLYIF